MQTGRVSGDPRFVRLSSIQRWQVNPRKAGLSVPYDQRSIACVGWALPQVLVYRPAASTSAASFVAWPRLLSITIPLTFSVDIQKRRFCSSDSEWR